MLHLFELCQNVVLVLYDFKKVRHAVGIDAVSIHTVRACRTNRCGSIRTVSRIRVGGVFAATGVHRML